MPQYSGVGDLTRSNLPSFGSRVTESYRPTSSTIYVTGNVLQLAALDLQTTPDFKTVQLSASGASQGNLVAVVSDTWPGFGGSASGAQNTAAPSQTLGRGTQFIEGVCRGAAPILVDQSGTSAITLTNGMALVACNGTAGYAMGKAIASAPGGLATIGAAVLPASGIGSSITAAALAQAAQTVTIAGTPAAGDIITVTIQSPYVLSAPGVAQTIAYVVPALTTAQAVSVTTAALAVLTYLNAQPSFSQYFTAAQVAGVITITVNALSTPFLVNVGTGTTVAGQFTLGISGMVANSLTITTGVNGGAGSTSTAGAGTFAAGTGYKGIIPALITGAF